MQKWMISMSRASGAQAGRQAGRGRSKRVQNHAHLNLGTEFTEPCNITECGTPCKTSTTLSHGTWHGVLRVHQLSLGRRSPSYIAYTISYPCLEHTKTSHCGAHLSESIDSTSPCCGSEHELQYATAQAGGIFRFILLVSRHQAWYVLCIW